MYNSNSIITPSEKRLQDSVSLVEVSPTDKPWDIHATERDQVQNLYLEAGHTYAARMVDCSQWLEFALKANTDVVGTIGLKLQDSRFCRIRHCPVCQWRRSLKWRAKFFQVLPQVRVVYPTARFLFLTLTIRNCELLNLRSTISDMNKAWRLLAKRKQFPAIGWVRSLEVTRSHDDTAHPHFHVLLMVSDNYFKAKGEYLNQNEWSKLWRLSLGVEYNPIVNIKVVKPKKNNRADGKEDDGLAAAVCETLKYTVKPNDLISNPVSNSTNLISASNWLCELTRQMHKLKAIGVGGVLKKYLSELEQEPEDLIHIEDTEDENESDLGHYYFQWRQYYKRYTL